MDKTTAFGFVSIEITIKRKQINRHEMLVDVQPIGLKAIMILLASRLLDKAFMCLCSLSLGETANTLDLKSTAK